MEKLSVSVNGSMGILLSCGIPCAGMEEKMKNGLRKMTLVTGILCAMSVTLCACSGDEPAVNQEERQTDADDLNAAADDLSPELPAGDNTDGADGDAPKEQEDVQGASGAWEDSAPALEGDIKELQDGCLTVESLETGLQIYDNPVGILTNNPPFAFQMFQMNNYMHVSPEDPENLFSGQLPLGVYCKGMGALGLPGDLSSQSRFVRAAFTKLNSVSGTSEAESVSQFFHILGSVEQQRGCCHVGEDKYEITIYTSCCNADKGVYYYTTYENSRITAVDMHREELDAESIIRYPMLREPQIKLQNR